MQFWTRWSDLEDSRVVYCDLQHGKSNWLVLPIQKVLQVGFDSRSLILCFHVTSVGNNSINSQLVLYLLG